MQKNFQLKNNKVIPNLIWNLPHKPFIGKQQTAWMRDPGQKPSGMTPNFITANTRGFTLIELLVVVLIIGILAAVALPQYQKAVEKSKATQALTLLKSIAQAFDSYYVANGTGPTSFADLDIDVPNWTGSTEWVDKSLVSNTISNEDWSLQIFTDPIGVYAGRISGPYAGAGWMYFLQKNNTIPAQQIICAERKHSGVVFSQDTGNYCKKIMNFSNQYTEGGVYWFD